MNSFEENVSLSWLTNYQIGGEARFFFEAKSEGDVAWAIREAKEKKLPIFILGSGTNILVRDEGFSGLVLRPNIQMLEVSNSLVKVGAGVLMQDLLAFAAERGLSGLEWAGGLPGTLGGAVRGNAGAFGGEIKDVVEEAESFDMKEEKIMRRAVGECDFSYRSSVFKKNGREIVLSAVLRLNVGNKEEIRAKIGEKVRYRLERHPVGYPNIGSIFKNVPVSEFSIERLGEVERVIKKDPFPVVPTAYLISEAGLKGTKIGGAVISPMHPNFIVNAGNAKAADVLKLIALIKKKVKEKFCVVLEEEVEIV